MTMKTRGLQSLIIFSAFVLGFSSISTAQTAASDFEDEPSLKFYMVSQDSNGKPAHRGDQSPQIPNDTKYFPYEDRAGEFFVTPAFMDENCLADVSSKQHPVHQGSVLNMTLTEDCAESFMHITMDNVGQRFGVVLNEDLITAPRINAPVAGGSFYIDFGASDTEAEALANRFNAHITR